MPSRKPPRQDRSIAPRRDPRELLAIFGGGAAGAVLRVVLAQVDAAADAPHWPWATFSANLTGAFLLGWLATRLQERLPLSSYRRPLLATGFCGAFTTFSTLQIELFEMVDAQRFTLAAGYVTASLVLGFACVHLATALARRTRMLA